MSEFEGLLGTTQHKGAEFTRIIVKRHENDDTILEKLGEVLAKPKNDKWAITWKEQSSQGRTEPENDTIAIVIDLPEENTGAVKAFDRKSGDPRFIVGTEHTGYKVIVIWDQEWWFRVSGSLSIGYISAIHQCE